MVTCISCCRYYTGLANSPKCQFLSSSAIIKMAQGNSRQITSPPTPCCFVWLFGTGCNENETDHLDRDQQPYPPSQKTKRMRTSFKHHQLRTMKSYFAINHNPDAKDLKQLAQKTGLTKRVLQVRGLHYNFSPKPSPYLKIEPPLFQGFASP